MVPFRSASTWQVLRTHNTSAHLPRIPLTPPLPRPPVRVLLCVCRYIYNVHPRTKTPTGAIILTVFFDCALVVLPLISPVAFNAILSITSIGYQISYAIPILLRVTVAKNSFVQSPEFSLGRFSIFMGWQSGIFLVVTSCFMLFPNSFVMSNGLNDQQNPYTFNYTCVVAGGLMILAFVYWYERRHSE